MVSHAGDAEKIARKAAKAQRSAEEIFVSSLRVLAALREVVFMRIPACHRFRSEGA
jgi:hypothetical protein